MSVVCLCLCLCLCVCARACVCVCVCVCVCEGRVVSTPPASLKMSAVPAPIPKPGDARKKRKPDSSSESAEAEQSGGGVQHTASGSETADEGGAAKRSRQEGADNNAEGGSAADAGSGSEAKDVAKPKYAHKFAVVCRSNMNRSMANHDILMKNGFSVCSYGIGKEVKVPSRDKKGRMFPFGTPYEDILKFLTEEDEQFNTDSRVIPMLKRNKEIKLAPEDFRKIPDEELRKIDVVICSEYDIFERVVEGARACRDALHSLPCAALCFHAVVCVCTRYCCAFSMAFLVSLFVWL